MEAWRVRRRMSNRKKSIYSTSTKGAKVKPSNIAKGAGRNAKKEFKQFLYIFLGSISELETQLIISTELSHLKDK